MKFHFPRGSTQALRLSTRQFSSSLPRQSDFTHAVIGAGAVGLAIARQLQGRPGASVVLIEKHDAVGTETSSRNSEVIHAGLYYGRDSLKTRLCVRGKELLYQFCQARNVPHRSVGKWIVAQDERERVQLEKIHALARELHVETRFLDLETARREEPDVKAGAAVLESASTGIIDSHTYMQLLLGDFEDRGGTTALASKVTDIKPRNAGSDGWDIQCTSPVTVQPGVQDSWEEAQSEECSITADSLINSAGLHAIPIANMVLPPSRHRTPFYMKGTYYAYSASRPKARRLIYPAPIPGHGGLGSHLTLDLGGRMRFGPDAEVVVTPTDYTPSEKGLEAAVKDISRYLPGLDPAELRPDYCGIRPKLARSGAVAEGAGFQDFYAVREEGFTDFVNLTGIESPGLTSSLAIAEMVEGLLYGSPS